MKMSSSSRIRGIDRSSTTTSRVEAHGHAGGVHADHAAAEHTTRAGGTPGTPQSSRPMPPLCFSRVSAAA
jgi:hypothetical protein